MNTRRWLTIITVCILIFAALASFKVLQIREAIKFAESFPEPSETVEAVAVSTAQVQATITTLGSIVAPQTITLHNEIEGRITAVHFKSGATVKQGDLLIELDSSEETARLHAAQARAELANIDLKRVKKLKHKKTVSEERVDQAQAQYKIAMADIQVLQAIIDKKNLRAPFNARTGIHNFEVGKYLKNNTLITTLVGLNDYLWVDFDLPYQQANTRIGTQIEVRISKHHKQPITATIVAKNSVVTTDSRTLQFRARLQTTIQLQPNSAVRVSIPNDSPQHSITIPPTAVRTDRLGEYVYLLKTSSQADKQSNKKQYRAQRQSVNTGFKDQQGITITSGLNVGDLIATQGSFKLREGLLVYIKSAQTTDSQPELAL